MNYLKSLVSIVLLMKVASVSAQKYNLGKVTVDELKEKQHPLDTTAAAAIIFKKGLVTFRYDDIEGFVKVTTVKAKIKIYKKEGYEWANHAVDFYTVSQSRDKLTFHNVATYNLVNGKVEKTKIKSDGEFTEQVNKYWGRKKITLPNVKEGSIVEYEYILESPRIAVFGDWKFQYDVPVNYSEFETIVPEYFDYKSFQRGVSNLKRTTSSLVNGASRDQFTDYITNYVAENLPAMREESYVNNIDNYRLAVSHELSSVRYPRQLRKLLSTDWESVVKLIYDDSDFGMEVNKTGYFESDLASVLAGVNSSEEKIGKIFSFVKSKVKWNNYVGYSCNDGVRNAYKKGTGNVAEINLMLTAMLRYAGLDANPILISTRTNGIASFPSHSAFNYVIAGVQLPGGLVMMDATEQYSLPNILPIRDLNWIGRLIRKDGTSTPIDLMPNVAAKEVVNMQFSVEPSGKIKGMLRKQLTNHEALIYRDRYLNLNEESYLDNLENRHNNIEVDKYSRQNATDLSQPIVESFEFTDSKSLEVINDKIYVNPLLFLTMTENPFKQAVRTYPIDFTYPNQTKYNVMIDVPAGYSIETLPAMASVATGEGMGSFKYIIGESNNKVQVSITFDLNNSIVSPKYYDVMKMFFQNFVDKTNEKIVFRKI